MDGSFFESCLTLIKRIKDLILLDKCFDIMNKIYADKIIVNVYVLEKMYDIILNQRRLSSIKFLIMLTFYNSTFRLVLQYHYQGNFIGCQEYYYQYLFYKNPSKLLYHDTCYSQEELFESLITLPGLRKLFSKKECKSYKDIFDVINLDLI